MNERIKKLWVGALRGDKYVQGQKALRTEVDGQFRDCCLGVLCDLHRLEHPENQWTPNDTPEGSVYYNGKFTYLGEDNILPDAVIDWAGVHDMNPTVDAESYRAKLEGGDPDKRVDVGTLASCNDAGLTFPQIADIIEKEL